MTASGKTAPAEILRRYGLDPNNASVTPLGNGLINQTFLVTDGQRQLVLQQLNTRVFAKPGFVVDNALRITEHLDAKHRAGEYSLQPIRQLPSIGGRYLEQDGAGYSWRALAYLGDNYSLDRIDNPEQARQAARAFGGFSAALADFDGNALAEVIPDFHNLDSRLAALDEMIAADPRERLAECAPALAVIDEHRHLAARLRDCLAGLPKRITHNDTKISNMLFSRTDDAALAVIDLDTCMPGYLLFDFGDMARGACSGRAEDHRELEEVCVREEIFAALAEGYLAGLAGVITDAERRSLLLGAQVMTLMLAVRFVTDYLDGDNYFQVSRPGHNLDRALNQLALLNSLVAKAPRLNQYLMTPGAC